MAKINPIIIDVAPENALQYAREHGMMSYFKKAPGELHSSGYATFEIGYCQVENGYATEKIVLGSCSDHLWIKPKEFMNTVSYLSISMDVTRNGYTRIWNMEHPLMLHWEEYYPMSSAMLILDPTTPTGGER